MSAENPNKENQLTHLNADGSALMVDVSGKASSMREAIASASVQTRPDVIALIEQALVKKGDVLATARIAGIMAAKKTSDVIPLCHPLPLSKVSIDFELNAVSGQIFIQSLCRVQSQTGVEMEALTAASVAALTIHLRYVQSGRPGHGDWPDPIAAKNRWQTWLVATAY